MRNKYAVIGLGFGDEGKGLVTDYLCSKANSPLVVRFSGGQQAGHTVVLDDGTRHVFSNFGSGSLRGVPTQWSQYCTIDPVAIQREMHVLQKIGVYPRLYIHPNCAVTTPYDKYANQNSKKMLKNGTCGAGFGTTVQREADHYSLLAKDICYDSISHLKVNQIENYYEFNGSISCLEFFQACEFIKSSPNISITDTRERWQGDIIYEGSQGLLLDPNIGFFPNVTRSNLGSQSLIFMEEVLEFIDFYFVTRAYQTRHGNGPMTNTDKNFKILEDDNETNGNHQYQGNFRRSMLDMELLSYSLEADEWLDNALNKNLVVTCLDHLKEYKITSQVGDIREFDRRKDFVDYIGNHLYIDDRFYSDGPTASHIKTIE